VSSQPSSATAADPPGVRAYSLVCLSALLLMILALVLRRPDAWVLFPALVGAMGLVFRLRAAPLLVLAAVVLLLWTWWIGTNPGWMGYSVGRWLWWLLRGYWVPFRLWGRGPRDLSGSGARPLSDLLLAVSLLTYAVGTYRLLGLTVRLFPPDPRRRAAARRLGPVEAKKVEALLRRPPALVTHREIGALLGSLSACGGATYMFWVWLRQGRYTALPLSAPVWHGLLILWLLGGGVLLAAALLRYLALRRMSATEAALYLQDVLWRETRREQRRLNRWLAWAWLRRHRREEKESS
jgi:hypothetical protein